VRGEGRGGGRGEKRVGWEVSERKRGREVGVGEKGEGKGRRGKKGEKRTKEKLPLNCNTDRHEQQPHSWIWCERPRTWRGGEREVGVGVGEGKEKEKERKEGREEEEREKLPLNCNTDRHEQQLHSWIWCERPLTWRGEEREVVVGGKGEREEGREENEREITSKL
jgi:hypothetical protein